MVVERLDMEPLLEADEEQRGSWDVALVTPEGVVLSGTLLVTDRRLLFHARQDHTRKGDWLEIGHMRQRFAPVYPDSVCMYAAGSGDAAHLVIPRPEVTRVDIRRGFLDRSVRITLTGSRVLTLRNAGFNAKKIVTALG